MQRPGCWKASRTRHLGNIRAREALLSSQSPACCGITEAPRGLNCPDVTSREVWVSLEGKTPKRSWKQGLRNPTATSCRFQASNFPSGLSFVPPVPSVLFVRGKR